MKILVTGHKGFIGSNLALYLMNQGHEVEGWEYQPNVIPSPEGYDCVVHLGAISDTAYTDVDQILEQNFEYSVRLVQACENFHVPFQYASSASVYGNCGNFTESGQVLPQSPYAWSKYLFDRFINQFMDEFEIPVQGFRYFNVYGRREDHKGAMSSPYTKFSRQAQQEGKIKLFKNSDQYVRDFVAVEDVCKVHEKMFDVTQSGIFNVGTGNPVSFEKVAETVAAKYNAVIDYIDMPESLRSQYQSYTCADTRKLDAVIDMNWHDILDYIEKYDIDV